MGCFVPGCSSNKGRGSCHLFRPPRNKPAIVEKWCEVLNKLRSDTQFDVNKRRHRVCSNHFEEKAIKKADRFIIQGKVVELPRQKWTLEDGAIPTVFDHLPKSVRPRVKAPRRKIVRVESTPNKKRKTASEATPIVEIKAEPGPDPLASPEPEPPKASHLLQKLCDRSNNSWRFIEMDKYASVFQMMFENGPKGIPYPFIYRAITTPANSTEMVFRFTISGCDVTSEFLNGEDLTEDSFAAAASRFDLIHKCRGLPGLENVDKCSSGVKRAGRWYSVECAGLGNAIVCVKCKLFHRTISQKATRQINKINNVDRVKVQQEKLKNVQSKVRYYSERCKKLKRSQVDLKRTLRTSKQEVREADVQIVRDSLSKLDIPAGMKENVIKSLKQAKLPSSAPKEVKIETDDDTDESESRSMSPSEQSEFSE